MLKTLFYPEILGNHKSTEEIIISPWSEYAVQPEILESTYFMQKLLIEVPNRAKHFARFFRNNFRGTDSSGNHTLGTVIYKFVK